MGVIKHEPNEPRKPRKPKKVTVEPAPVPYDYRSYLDLSELAEPLHHFASTFAGYAHDATLGEHGLDLFTGKNSHPVRLVLEGDAVGRIADALGRIADAMGKTNEAV